MKLPPLALVAGISLFIATGSFGAEPLDLAWCVNAENPARRAGAYIVVYLHVFGGDPFAHYMIQSGDALEYDLMVGPATPRASGGLDLHFTDLDWLTTILAQRAPEVAVQATNSLALAVSHWQHVSVPLAATAGRRIDRCCVRITSDEAGLYQVALDNIVIRRTGQPPLVFYDNQDKVVVGLQMANGFRMPHSLVFKKSLVPMDASLPAMMRRLYETSLELSRLTATFTGMKLLQEDFAATGAPTNFPSVAEQISRYGGRQLLRELRAHEFAKEMDALVAEAEPLRSYAKHYTVDAVAYAHLDFIWLWSWTETLQAARDTFRQMLVFMDDFPQFRFTYTSPALFEAVEQEDPALFAQIQQRAREGRWEMAGSRWCEADPNLISEESHARHFLEAQRYNMEKFGTQTTVCYEPDIFGHLPTMPQLLRKAGLLYYVSQHMPDDPAAFWWDGPDGSRVLGYRPRNYSDTLDEHILDSCLPQNQRLAGYTDSLIVYGVGDHGGGPTRDQIENALWLDKLPVFPSVKFSTLQHFMETVSREAEAVGAPVRRGDLNLDCRGTYTTHAEIKRLNRLCENTLTMAESFDAISQVLGLQTRTNRFDNLWRSLLWAHHHDTISGTTIHSSSLYAEQRLGSVLSNATVALGRALSNITAAANTDGPTPHPCVAFNPVAWPVVTPVHVPLPDPTNQWEWLDVTGHASPVQRDVTATNSPTGTVVLSALPGFGYRVGWLRPREATKDDGALTHTAPLAARNRYIELEISPQSGNIIRLAHVASTTEWVRTSAPAARLRVYYEQPHDWSAWDIGPVDHAEWLDKPTSVTCAEDGPVRIVFRARYEFGRSHIDKDIILYRELSRVDLALHVDWQERGSEGAPFPWLRLEFPVTASVSNATYMIPFGEIERPADGTDYPALYGMGIDSPQGSLCLVSDSKTGFSATRDTIGVSLLRSPYYPDPASDVGQHEITLALEISSQPWAQAAMARHGLEFNRQPIVVSTTPHKGPLPAEKSFLAVEPSTVVLTALKTSYDSPSNLIIRLYQSAQNPCVARLTSALPSAAWTETDLIERPLTNAPAVDPLHLSLGSWDVRTYQFTPKR